MSHASLGSNIYGLTLYIIQHVDNRADIYRELECMSEVYSNSYCNISAEEALDGHHSLFSFRNPRTIYPPVISMTIGGCVTPFLVVNADLWFTEVSGSHINKRAWILQERLLSPRVLHFGASQLLGECCTKEAAEVHPPALTTYGPPQPAPQIPHIER
jgi:hypothetical protein